MLLRHLRLPAAVWPGERCASMRYLSSCARELDRPDEEEQWLLRACAEAPALREPWLDLARFFLRREDWHGVVWAARRALRITKRPETYLTEPEAWGELPYDLLAVALYYLGDYRHALAMGEEALKRSPMDRRLRENVRLMRQRAIDRKKISDIEETGDIFISGPDAESVEAAKKSIETIVFVPEVGSLYFGKVVRIMQFGAFVELAPGKDGLVHISKLANHRVAKVEDVVNIGDMIWVKVTDIDEKGRVNLSHKDALREIREQQAQK